MRPDAGCYSALEHLAFLLIYLYEITTKGNLNCHYRIGLDIIDKICFFIPQFILCWLGGIQYFFLKFICMVPNLI